MEATVILCKCYTSRKTFGMRTQKMADGDWWRTWAFPIDDKRATREGYDRTQIQGNLYTTEEYLGCPSCGTKNFVQCGRCQKLTCWTGDEVSQCRWCGNHFDSVVTATSKFDLSGGDI